jgi:hypothetical protein
VGSLFAVAEVSSGLPSGPVGTPVISTPSLTSRAAVLVVGDSITMRSYKYLPPAMPGVLIAVNAQSGRNTKLSVDSLIWQTQHGAKLPPKLVMATGANDIFNTHAMGPQVQRLLAFVKATSPTTKVYWVDVSVRRPAYAVADMFNSAMVNTQIRKYCVGNCSVISWAALLAKYGRTGLIDSGGVHTTVLGSQKWAGMIAGGIK